MTLLNVSISFESLLLCHRICNCSLADIPDTYDKELVSRNEEKQHHAVKSLYQEYEKGIAKKKHMLHFCHTLGHKVMPSVAIWQVSYLNLIIIHIFSGLSSLTGWPGCSNTTCLISLSTSHPRSYSPSCTFPHSSASI